MKLNHLLIGLLVINATLVLPGSISACKDTFEITIADEYFEAVLREHIDKPDGELLNTDLEGLTLLYFHSNDIESIEGIQYCIDLTEVHLSSYNPGFNDISLLASLGNLTSVLVHGTEISDISTFTQMPQLTELQLFGNKINDLPSFCQLENLIYLSLSFNEINDIEPLACLVNLEILSLSRNQINDISALAGLESLHRLELDENQISDITPLLQLSNLRDLSIEENPLSDESINNVIPELEDRGVSVIY